VGSGAPGRHLVKQFIWRLPDAPPVSVPNCRAKASGTSICGTRRPPSSFPVPRGRVHASGRSQVDSRALFAARYRSARPEVTAALPDTRCAPGSREGDVRIMREAAKGVDKRNFRDSFKSLKSRQRIFDEGGNGGEAGGFCPRPAAIFLMAAPTLEIGDKHPPCRHPGQVAEPREPGPIEQRGRVAEGCGAHEVCPEVRGTDEVCQDKNRAVPDDVRANGSRIAYPPLSLRSASGMTERWVLARMTERLAARRR
jgi:hypothetical protein